MTSESQSVADRRVTLSWGLDARGPSKRPAKPLSSTLIRLTSMIDNSASDPPRCSVFLGHHTSSSWIAGARPGWLEPSWDTVFCLFYPSIMTIEHLWQHADFLHELIDVLWHLKTKTNLQSSKDENIIKHTNDASSTVVDEVYTLPCYYAY